MAQIEGLNEQQEALKRVTQNVKKIEEINSFLKNVSSLSKDSSVSLSYNISVSVVNGTDNKKFKCPMILQDNHSILDGVQEYKNSIVALVRQDSAQYRIVLTPKENATLDWKLVM